MAASEKYVSRFTSIEGNEYVIWVTTDRPIVDEPNTVDGTTPTYEFTLKEYGFELQYQNSGDDIFSALRTSSLRFSWEIQNTADLQEFNEITSNTNQNWYVTLLKNDALDWWGYLNLENFTQPWQQPTAVDLEAVDQLTLVKNLRFMRDASGSAPWLGNISYANAFTGTDIVYGGNGFSNRFLFGRSDDPVTSYNDIFLGSVNSRSDPGQSTLIEFFWSLLYDIEEYSGLLNPIGSNAGPGGLSVMIKYENINRVGNDGIWDEIAVNLFPWWADNYRNIDAQSLLAYIQTSEYTVGEIMEEVLGLWNCRIFLSDGRYWIVQYRTYADTPFISSDYSANVSVGAISTTPNIDSVDSSTLPNIAANTISLDSGINHFLKATPQIQYLNKLSECVVEYYKYSGKSRLRAYITNADPTNLAGANLEGEDVGIKNYNPYPDPVLKNAGNTVHEGDYFLYDGTNWVPVATFTETSGSGVFQDLAQLMVFGRMQARNAVNIKLKATIISPELSYFQPVIFQTQRYVANEFTRFGKADEVRGSWIRLNLSNEGIELEDLDIEQE